MLAEENTKTEDEQPTRSARDALVDLVVGQTALTGEEAYERLERAGGNAAQVISEFVAESMKTAKEEVGGGDVATTLDVNQQALRQIRDFMDRGAETMRANKVKQRPGACGAAGGQDAS